LGSVVLSLQVLSPAAQAASIGLGSALLLGIRTLEFSPSWGVRRCPEERTLQAAAMKEEGRPSLLGAVSAQGLSEKHHVLG
jgi:hypothetical protein